MTVKIIAEIGINHCGDLKLAKEMIDAAIDCGASYIKFQTYITQEVMLEETPLAEYMGGEHGSFFSMAKTFEFSRDETIVLKEYCERAGGKFISAPFDVESVRFLSELELDFIKIPSGEAVNPFVLRAVGKTGLPVVMSTGMCDLEEVRSSLETLRSHGAGEITLLHCSSQYPADLPEVNLRAMTTLHKEFDVSIGYSDHTLGIEVSLAAVALGATVIEKHFTTDKSLPGPDQAASLDPAEFRQLVRCIRNVELALGTFEKNPSEAERRTALVARKSLIAVHDLKAGEILDIESVTAKRPGTGIPSANLDAYLGRCLVNPVQAGTQLKPTDFLPE